VAIKVIYLTTKAIYLTIKVICFKTKVMGDPQLLTLWQ
jgi:hypothetical protein